MKPIIKDIIKAVSGAFLAGICISIGCMVYLNVTGVLGACLFSVGLMTVMTYSYPLFTGQAWRFLTSGHSALLIILVGNILGCFCAAYFLGANLTPAASAIVSTRLSLGWLTCGLLAIPCGFLMTTAVRQENWILVIFCVAVFILCGFPHCIADAFYYFCSPLPITIETLKIYGATIIGNYIGCNLYRLYEHD